MVNDTLGGRDLAIPYCTLCGSAQAYFTDRLPEGVERPILRTSGLLIRSNKVMYDVVTHSVFDTFLGTAVTGPLAEKGIALEQASVITTDWASWKAKHPDTTVLVEALALGRDFDFRNTRDADGPIFPVGDVDPRLPVHEDVIGVVTASGTPDRLPAQHRPAGLATRSGNRGGERPPATRRRRHPGGGCIRPRPRQPSGLLVRLVAVPPRYRALGRLTCRKCLCPPTRPAEHPGVSAPCPTSPAGGHSPSDAARDFAGVSCNQRTTRRPGPP